MAITPKPGYQVDPNNPNGVIPVGATPAAPVYTPPAAATNTPGTPGYNPTGGEPLAPAGGTPSPYYPRYTANEQAAATYLDTPVQEKSVEQARAEKTSAAQARIDALNKYYDTLVGEQNVINQGRDRSTSSVSTLSGLAGSSEANVQQQKTTDLNQRDTDKIQAERGNAIQSILANIELSSVEEAKQSRIEARQSAQDILANRTKNQTDAVAHLTQLAKASSGATLEGLKATLPAEQYDFLIRNAGGEAQAKAILFENRPKDTVLGSPQLMGGKMVQAFTTPDGKVKYESIDLPAGVKPDNIKSIEKTDNGIFIINNDGTYSKVAGTEDTLGNDLKRAQAANAWASAGKTKAETAAAGAGAADPAKAAATISLVKDSIDNATKLANASGRSGARKLAESWLVGSTDYTNLQAETNTIKTNVLTLMADPTIKKFFGPQMSNADVTLMTSAGTTLNPELQSPEAMTAELTRLKDLLGRMEKAVPANGGSAGSAQPSQIQYQGQTYNVDASGNMTPAQ